MKALVAGLVAALLVAPLFVGTATAADVNANLIASGFAWHFGSASGASTFTINAGDTLHLTITNPTDGTLHTFTFPHFSVDVSVPAGGTVTVTINTTSADAGSRQFHCTPHPSMVGTLVVQGPTPPRTPGFEAVAALGAIVAAFAAVLAVRGRDD